MLTTRHRALVTMTPGQARVLLAAQGVTRLFGIDLADLPEDAGLSLPAALAQRTDTVEGWTARLAGLSIPLLDINMAPADDLLRIPNLAADAVAALIAARPYLDLQELHGAGPDLAAVAAHIAPYVGHDGYAFIDKPAAKAVRLEVDLEAGVLLRVTAGADPAALTDKLDCNAVDDPRLFRCHWHPHVAPDAYAPSLRTLKLTGAVETLAPVLRDDAGTRRLIYPQRLDAMLQPGADNAVWERLCLCYGLTTVFVYPIPDYRSLQVEAHPQDVTALFRALRALVQENVVRYVEPTYIAMD